MDALTRVVQGENEMKAWYIRNKNDSFFATVVFAETRGKAKAVALTTDTCEDCDFNDIQATRVPELDDAYRGVSEMDWDDPDERIRMVKDAGFSCLSDLGDCYACPAEEWCDRAKELEHE